MGQAPVIYELNTWAWLHGLSQRYGRPVSLDSVPESEWDGVAAWRVDAVWLMGVWERSPQGAAIASENASLRAEFEKILPDYRPEDNIGSAYCVRDYHTDARLGGEAGLQAAREALLQRGLMLVLDYVPNHIARDHPWVEEHPEYLIQGSAGDLHHDPGAFFKSNDHIIACGRDPYFPPWRDVAQVNAFHEGLRQATIEAVSSIAERCDGLRCDMAMLMMNAVFSRTWGERAGPPPEADFWPTVIEPVRRRHPDLLFIAEAYWDLEWALQQQGFDYCYDKRLYDRLLHDDAASVRSHLHAERRYQNKLVRFIENHDEQRAAASLVPAERAKAAAVAILTLPGAKLLHEGQFEGRRIRLPVFLRRRPDEPEDTELQGFYRRLLDAVGAEPALRGEWSLCETGGWPDNPTHDNLLAWCWRAGDRRLVVIINDSGRESQGRIFLPWPDVAEAEWRLTDPINEQEYLRSGVQMSTSGLYVSLAPWSWHYLTVSSANALDNNRAGVYLL